MEKIQQTPQFVHIILYFTAFTYNETSLYEPLRGDDHLF